jgi:2'-5' RNA ligase
MTASAWRCFCAVDLGDGERAVLLEQTAPLRATGAEVRFTRETQIHVTLKFLGDTDPELLPRLRSALSSVRIEPFEWSVRGLGFFPPRGRPRVLWAGIEDGGRLAALARRVEDAVVPLGFARERRPFRSHLTLARVRGPRGLRELEQRVAALGGSVSVALAPALAFVLYRSHLEPAGSRYERLGEFAFG